VEGDRVKQIDGMLLCERRRRDAVGSPKPPLKGCCYEPAAELLMRGYREEPENSR
jgi:hypothetical protein